MEPLELSHFVDDQRRSLEQLIKGDGVHEARPLDIPQIRRVPFGLREQKNIVKYFEPRIVSIGPIHHGTDKFKPAEKIKLRLAAQFIKEKRQDIESLFKKIRSGNWMWVKMCYADEIVQSLDDDYLAWVHTVDGCAILQFIQCVVNNEGFDRLRIRSDIVTLMTQDLFLLENQIPFEVLRLLSIFCNLRVGDFILLFIGKVMNVGNVLEPKSEPVHLLDLLRSTLVGKENDIFDFRIKVNAESSENMTTFRNVKELRAIGIDFRPSASRCLKDIEFKSRFLGGTLKLPPIIVDDSTATKFLNLAAYEMCPDFPNEFEVISYTCFLDSLINQPEDVKELKRANILFNSLGSDERVANLFNEMSSALVPNPEMYSKVKQDIGAHCRKRWSIVATWIHQAKDTYFSSPWALIAFIAAVLGLAMTFIQTWYAVQSAN